MLALMLAGLSGSLFAVDGTILIDQNRALAGSVTPGDFPGFPVSITQPGSYRLSGNLTVAANVTSAIIISANNVTLDLNGFSISGPAPTCSNPQLPACAQVFGVGTLGFNQYKGIKVRNGTITGFNAQLSLNFVSQALAEDLTLFIQTGQNISTTNSVGSSSIVRHIVTDDVFSVFCPGTLVVENVATGYLRQGSDNGCVFSNNIGPII
jgi:hypothetical protein